MNNSTNAKYDAWCQSIADSHDTSELIKHLRDHVYLHFERHKDEGELGFKSWLVGTLNFMYILEKKFPGITKEDRLFKVCRFYIKHKKGPKPDFDMDQFVQNYNGDIKDYHRNKDN